MELEKMELILVCLESFRLSPVYGIILQGAPF